MAIQQGQQEEGGTTPRAEVFQLASNKLGAFIKELASGQHNTYDLLKAQLGAGIDLNEAQEKALLELKGKIDDTLSEAEEKGNPDTVKQRKIGRLKALLDEREGLRKCYCAIIEAEIIKRRRSCRPTTDSEAADIRNAANQFVEHMTLGDMPNINDIVGQLERNWMKRDTRADIAGVAPAIDPSQDINVSDGWCSVGKDLAGRLFQGDQGVDIFEGMRTR